MGAELIPYQTLSSNSSKVGVLTEPCSVTKAYIRYLSAFLPRTGEIISFSVLQSRKVRFKEVKQLPQTEERVRGGTGVGVDATVS